MEFCSKCGCKLIDKECGKEGMIPYCPNCNEFRFPMFNSAISTIILNPKQDKILLIQQYGRTDNILVAGYINQGENANQALIREVKEETGLDVVKYMYNDNEYYERTNTLMHNFIAIVDCEEYVLNEEIDQANWYNYDEAVKQIRPNSLAKIFLEKALKKLGEINENKSVK